MTTHRFYTGDVIEALRTLPDESIHCCVTSPPYFGLRDYGQNGQIGLEKTPEEYVSKMLEVFREVRRVLRADATLWLNLGDSYNGSGGAGGDYCPGGLKEGQPKYPGSAALKPKDLIGIPWRVALALQNDGWYLRSDIIWSKANCMPSSVTDRPTSSHEHVFLLTKSARYFYDNEAIKEDCVNGDPTSSRGSKGASSPNAGLRKQDAVGKNTYTGFNDRYEPLLKRNKRDVWTISTQPFPGAHFAVMPEALVEPCILAGTSEKGCCPKCGKPWERVIERTGHVNKREPAYAPHNAPTKTDSTGWRPVTQATDVFIARCSCGLDPIPCTVLDPFGGSGTVSEVSRTLGRSSVYIDLNPEYADMAVSRMRPEQQSLMEPFEIERIVVPSGSL